MKKAWIKPVIIVCIVAVVGAGGYFTYQKFFKANKKATVSYMRLKATKGTMAVTVTASGTVTSAVSEDIIPENSGTLSALNVKQGDTVTAGQSIAKLDDPNSQQAVQKAQNALTQQNLSLSKIKESLSSYYIKSPVNGTVKTVNISVGDDVSAVSKVLSDASSNNGGPNSQQNGGYSGGSGLIDITYTDGNGQTQVAHISAQSGTVSNIYVSAGTSVKKGDSLFKLNSTDVDNSINSQNLSIQQAQSDLSNAQTQAGKDNITSPVSGTIAVLNNKVGDNIQAGKALGTVVDLTQLQTSVQVDEMDISKVKVGQKANITLDDLPGQTFTGKVLNIATLGTTTNGVTTYPVTVSIDNPSNIKIGMTTNVEIEVQSKDNVVMLPIEAVTKIGNTGTAMVIEPASGSQTSGNSGQSQQTSSGSGNGGNWQGGGNGQSRRSGGGMNNYTGSVNRVRVQTGMTNQNYVEITSGVNEGDTVLVQIIQNTSSSSSTTNRNAMGGFGGGMGGFGGGGNFGGGGATRKAGN